MRLSRSQNRISSSNNLRLNERQQQRVARREQRMLLSRQRRQDRVDRYRRAFPRWLPLSWTTETMLVQMVVGWFKSNYEKLKQAISIPEVAGADQTRFQFAVETLEEKVMLSAVSISTTPPVVDSADIASLVTPTTTEKLWTDTRAIGQTFTTGSQDVILDAITLLHSGSGANEQSLATKNYTITVGEVSGTSYNQIASESATQSTTWERDDYITFTLDTPVTLSANSVYGFDLAMNSTTTGWPTGIPYMFATSNAVYADGQSFRSQTNATSTPTIGYINQDKVFHLNLAPATPPLVAVDDTATVSEDSTGDVIDVLANDTAPSVPGGVITGVTIEDSSSQLAPDFGFDRQAAYVVDGSGLAGGAHGVVPDGSMWLSDGTFAGGSDPLPAHITFDLEANYDLDSFHVWNYNEAAAGLSTRGANDVEISVADSVGGSFTSLGNFNFAKATGLPSYTGETIDLSSFAAADDARLVRFDIISSHGGDNNFAGLSEVQFTSAPAAADLTIISTTENTDGGPGGSVTITNGGSDVTYDPNGQFEYLAVGETATDTFTYTVANPGPVEVISGVTIEDFSSELASFGRFAVDSINGTGLSGGAHNTNPADMWEAQGTFGGGTDTPPWHITYDMEANYAMDSIHVWNFNEAGSLSTAGAKDVEIWVSPDDNVANLVKLDNAGGDFVFAQAPGAPGYTGFDVDLSGVTNSSLLDDVRLVRFDIQTSHGQILDLVGLSEVQFSAATSETDSATVTVTITGENDAPVIGAGTTAGAVTETDATNLIDSGSVSVSDVDTTDEVDAAVISVTATGDDNGISNAALLSMMSLGTNPVIDSSSTTGAINWTFNSGSEAFDHLRKDETLLLDYTINATDTDPTEIGAGGSLAGATVLDNPGTRLNIDEANTTILGPGTYDVPSVTFKADAGTGTGFIRPFLAIETAANTYETIWVGSQINVTSTGVDSVSYAGETFTLTASTEIFSGVYHTGGARVFLAGGGTTDHDSTATEPTATGQAISGFSNPNLGRTYAFGVDVAQQNTWDSQVVSITINGTNDAPELTLDDASGAVIEDTSGGASETDSGGLSFTDDDTDDTHTVTTSYNGDAVWTGGGLSGAQITAITSGFSADSDSWDYTVANNDLDFVGYGETITLSFDVTVTDDSGAGTPGTPAPNENDSDTETVTLTISGSNDQPDLTVTPTGSVTEDASSPAANETASGTVSITDLDTNDTHTVTESYNNDAVWSGGSLSPAQEAAISSTTTNFTADGTGWDYTVANADIQFLAASETITLSFDVKATDDSGAIDIGAGGSLAGGGLDTPGGTRLNIDEVNTTTLGPGTYEVPSVSFNADAGGGGGFIRHFVAVSTGANTYETVWVGGAINITTSGVGSVSYTGETFTLTSTETIYSGVYHTGGARVFFAGGGSSDHDGTPTEPSAAGQSITGISNPNLGRTYASGVDVAAANTMDTETVTITINGSNDSPVITSGPQTGTVTETADAGAVDPDPADATGTITFDDADLTDTHTATILDNTSITGSTATLTSTQAAALLDNLSLGAVVESPTTSSGSVAWTYDVPNSEIDFLSAGETVEVTHTVEISDGVVINVPFVNADFEADNFTVWPGYANDNGGVITGWSYTGSAGINPVSGGSAPFRNNGANSTQVAFIQATGSLSQTINGLTVGQTYELTFDYNERAAGGSTTITASIAGETFTDNNVNPVGGSNPYHTASLIFTATATSEALTITSASNGGDQTSLFDNVQITEKVTQDVVVTIVGTNDAPVANDDAAAANEDGPAITIDVLPNDTDVDGPSETIVNADFETDANLFDTFPGYLSNPSNPSSITGWTHTGAGVGVNPGDGAGSPFRNNGDNTSNVAFIQGTGSISQVVSGLVVGAEYELTFDYNEREPGGSTTITADIAGANFTDTNNTPVGGTNPYHQASLTFTATSTSETLTISSVSNGGDQTSLIDNVQITSSLESSTTISGTSASIGLVTINDNGTPSTGLDDYLDYDPNGQFEYLAAGEIATDTFTYTISDNTGVAATGLSITDLFNTGVDGSGAALGNDVDDPHYVITVDPSGLGDATVPDGTFPIGPWVANDGDSRWIGPDASAAVGPAGDYTYTTTFTLPSDVDLSSVSITGSWATDNVGGDILINGVSTGQTNVAQFGSLTAFAINSGFVTGTNTIDFLVNNAGSGAGPTGLRVDDVNGTYDTVAGATDTATVTVTITGQNDAPVISAHEDGEVTEDASGGATETDSGTVDFGDVDLTDTHSASAVFLSTTHGGGQLGNLTASVTTDTTGTGTGGEATWNFSVNNAAIQFLGVGDTITETYTVTVTDAPTGATDTVDVDVIITGTNDAPIITAHEDGAVTEDASAGLTETDSGKVDFTDVDLTDAHAASAAFSSTTHTGQLGSMTTPVTVTTDTTGSGTGGVATWNYSVNNAAIQFMANGETITETYTVTVADNESTEVALFNTGAGLANGSNDPNWTITASPSYTGPAIVQSNHPAWLANNASSSWLGVTASGTTNVAPGTYTFETTFDLTGLDESTASLSLLLATDNSVTDVLINGTSTGITQSGFGGFGGPFAISSGFVAGVNTLTVITNNAGTGNNPAGFRAELSGTANAVDTVAVDVKITGTNDTPTIDATDSAALVEDETDPILTDGGTLNFGDVDLTDTHSVNAVTASPAVWSGGAILPAGLQAALDAAIGASITDVSTGDGTGTIDWDFNLANADVQFLAAGETLTATYTATVTDDDASMASADSTITVVITGVNDGPVAVDDAYTATLLGGLDTVINDFDTTPRDNVGDTTPGDTTDDSVLINDTDVDTTDVLTVTSTGTIITTLGATVEMLSDGSFTYDATTSGILLGSTTTQVDTFDYTMTDDEGATSSATVSVTVPPAAEKSVNVIDCACDDGASQAIVIRGTNDVGDTGGEGGEGDKIKVKLGGEGTAEDPLVYLISIKSPDTMLGGEGAECDFTVSADNISKIIIYGLDGDDQIKIDSKITASAWLFGGNGDDKLRGGSGHDLLVGNAGDDQIDGKDGRDVAIGGQGADKINGDKHDDILIAAETAYDSNLLALCDIMAKWQIEDANKDGLTGDEGGEGGEAAALADAEVRGQMIKEMYFQNGLSNDGSFTIDDGAEDELKGGHGADWLIADTDEDKFKTDEDEDIFGLDTDWFNLDDLPVC